MVEYVCLIFEGTTYSRSPLRSIKDTESVEV